MSVLEVQFYAAPSTPEGIFSPGLLTKKIRVWLHRDLNVLLHTLHVSPHSLVVLFGNAAELSSVLHRLLEANTAGVLCILPPDNQVEDRLALIAAGADVCLAWDVPISEIEASLSAMARRQKRVQQEVQRPERFALHDIGRKSSHQQIEDLWLTMNAEPKPQTEEAGRDDELQTRSSILDSWKLHSSGWFVITSDGKAVRLHRNDRQLLYALMQERNECVPTSALYRAIYGLDVALGRHKAAKSTIATQVCRLRKQLRQHGLDLPVISVRAEGYVFMDVNHAHS